jgi:hypothetical protein
MASLTDGLVDVAEDRKRRVRDGFRRRVGVVPMDMWVKGTGGLSFALLDLVLGRYGF